MLLIDLISIYYDFLPSFYLALVNIFQLGEESNIEYIVNSIFKLIFLVGNYFQSLIIIIKMSLQ